MKKSIHRCLLGVAVIAALVGLLRNPQTVQSAILQSMLTCLNTLTPSLFPFLVVTSVLIRAEIGQGQLVRATLGKLCRVLFRLPESCAVPLCMGLLGGYPTGAKAASMLLQKGELTEEQAGRMLLFCVSPGLAFSITYVGGRVLHSTRLGWLLFLSVTLASVVLGAASAYIFGQKCSCAKASPAQGEPAAILTPAFYDAARAMLSMSACIVAFSAILALLRAFGVPAQLVRLLTRVLPLTPPESAAVTAFLAEVTGGVQAALELQAGAAVFAFGLGFGGVCVHLQVLSCFPKRVVSLWRFFLFRFLHGGLSALIFCGLSRLFPASAQAVFLAMGAVESVSAVSGSAAGSVSLLLMCAAFLLSLRKSGDDRLTKHRV